METQSKEELYAAYKSLKEARLALLSKYLEISLMPQEIIVQYAEMLSVETELIQNLYSDRNLGAINGNCKF